MKEKALVIVAQDEILPELVKELDETEKDFKDGLKFLEKQRSALWDKTLGVTWSKIESRLIEKGLLEKTLDSSKERLQIRSGVIYLADRLELGKHPLAQFFGSMFEGD